MNPVANVSVTGFAATADGDDRHIMVTLKGEADQRAKPHLEGFFRAVHEAALRGRSLVRIDLTGLQFMNSSGLQEFVTWFSEVTKSPAGTGYQVRFVADLTQYWQRRSLQALVAFAPDHVAVDA